MRATDPVVPSGVLPHPAPTLACAGCNNSACYPTPHCPLHPCLCTCCPHLFVCLFVSPSRLFLLIDGQWTSAKSNCTCSIRRTLGRRLRSSLLLNSSPSTSSDHPLVPYR